MGIKDVFSKAKTKVNEIVEKGNSSLTKLNNTKSVTFYSSPIVGGFIIKKAFYEEKKLLFPKENFNKNDIKRAIKNNDRFKDYYWSYTKYNNILKENPEILEKVPRKVYQYTLDGDFVKEWDSITSCKKEYPSVLQVCLGNRNHCKKFKFSFNKLMI